MTRRRSKPPMRTIIITVLITAGVVLAAYTLWHDDTAQQASRDVTSLAGVLGGDSDEALSGYRRATAVRSFSFPRDHGPHPEYKHEWWYFTGNVETAAGRHFGYQLTLFRIALSPTMPARQSAWATNQLYMAHFAVSDVATESFHAFERFSRGALQLAGAQATPFKVWLEDWTATGGEDTFPVHLEAGQDGVAIDLHLRDSKPIILQGERGLSRKSAAPGNASYYYSLTRLPTHGTISINGQNFTVRGNSWLDREWFTSALGDDQEGWDWFALQLSDNRELMYYRLRNKDGTGDEFSSGTLVDSDGTYRTLTNEEVTLEPMDQWRSPATGMRYPVTWRLRVPQEDMALEIMPYINDQELDVSVTYWEGAVRVTGRARGKPVTGNGYLEMTGYQ